MLSNQTTIKTLIADDRQRWVDEPVYLTIAVRQELCSPIAKDIAKIFKTGLPKDIEMLTEYKRYFLAWHVSDGNGGTKLRGQ